MIAFLKGVIAEKQPTRVLLEVGGVGYEVLVPLSSFDAIGAVGEACRMLTVDHVREDVHQLFGFMTEEERSLFVQLTGVSGIGPKLALSALSGLSVRELCTSITGGDVKRLSSISGIGKKMAERMVVELRDKIAAGGEGDDALAGMVEPSGSDLVMRDAMLALVALGYKQDAARKMVSGVMKKGAEGLEVEEIVKRALGG